MRGCTEAHQSAVSSLEWTRTATRIELDHATDCWLDDDGPEPPRKAPRVHKDGSTQTAWTCPTFRPGDLVKKSMPKTRPDTWDVFRVLSVDEDGGVIVEVEDVYLGSTLEADPHHFRHLTDEEIRTRTTDFAVCEAGTPASTASPPPWKAAEIEGELKLAAESEVLRRLY